ncbi:MAG: hypothetical protein LC792_02165 [Actinobacteria bacterium]|nr:hypothetical protein [Actinomycetota bacterium]
MDTGRTSDVDRLVELSRAVDDALQRRKRTEAKCRAEELLDALFAHHRALHPFRERSDPLTAAVLETATVGMIAEVALTIGELGDGGRVPASLLRRHVEQLADLEADVLPNLDVPLPGT